MITPYMVTNNQCTVQVDSQFKEDVFHSTDERNLTLGPTSGSATLQTITQTKSSAATNLLQLLAHHPEAGSAGRDTAD